MTTPSDLYPLSTIDGKEVPLEVIKPIGIMIASFSSSPSSPVAIPDASKLIGISSTEDCFVLFANATISVPANNTYVSGVLFVPADTIITVIPSAAYYSVVSASSNNGTLTLQFLETWHGLALPTQFVRR